MRHWGTRLHAAVYRWSRGRLLGRIAGRPVLLLHTTGRRTGRPRTTPVQFQRLDGAVVVVASNAGAPRPPAWYLNLRARPEARIRLGAETRAVRAREVTGPEREALWQRLAAGDRALDRVARKAGRELPLLVLDER